jgi:glycosyltransferase involved in cell wall biosynthesis
MPDVVIPVLDEAAALPALLLAMPRGYHPIVVDNGSTDGSAQTAQACGAQVLTEASRGFGAACWAGLVASSPLDGVVCFMDGDGSLDPADLPRVARPVLEGDVDLMLGARAPTTKGAWPRHARAANTALAWAVRRRSIPGAGPCTVRDIGPMRAARRDGLLQLGLVDRGFGWPLEMVICAVRAGWRIDEVPVPYRPRIGRSKVTGTVRGTARAIRDMGRVLR